MRLLLDTHVWLWLQAEPERLSRRARKALSDPSVELYFSVASTWEIAVKVALGKLRLPEEPETYVLSRLRLDGVRTVAIDNAHALLAARLPYHHKDPFDRLLLAQASVEGLRLCTADEQLRAYEVELLWAGR